MYSVALLLVALVASASAFAPVAAPARSGAVKAVENELGVLPPLGFWDPLGCSGMSFWTLDNDQTVGYLRHAEIKHGRVAMAAFLGYCVQCLGVVKGEHTFLPYRGYVADVTPQEQWDNIPVIGKLQILTFVGMLESYGEIPGDVPHYTAPGGLPGSTTFDQGQPPGDPLRPLHKPFDHEPQT